MNTINMNAGHTDPIPVELDPKNMTTPLYSAKLMFRNSLKCYTSLSYEDWMALEHDSKAAGLYVNFYDQITLAWHKAKSFYGEEEEAVETILQYLEKNVPIIEADKNRYNPKYIYRVAYNCLYCICHDRKRDKDRWTYECSNIVATDDAELDLFDTVVDSRDIFEKQSIANTCDEFWSIIENMDEDTQTVVQELLGYRTKSKKISDEFREHAIDLLRGNLGKFLGAEFC